MRGNAVPLVGKITKKHPPCQPYISLHPLEADSVLKFPRGHDQLRRIVESSRARFIFLTEAAISCAEQIAPTGNQRHRNGIEHLVIFKIKQPVQTPNCIKMKK